MDSQPYILDEVISNQRELIVVIGQFDLSLVRFRGNAYAEQIASILDPVQGDFVYVKNTAGTYEKGDLAKYESSAWVRIPQDDFFEKVGEAIDQISQNSQSIESLTDALADNEGLQTQLLNFIDQNHAELSAYGLLVYKDKISAMPPLPWTAYIEGDWHLVMDSFLFDDFSNPANVLNGTDLNPGDVLKWTGSTWEIMQELVLLNLLNLVENKIDTERTERIQAINDEQDARLGDIEDTINTASADATSKIATHTAIATAHQDAPALIGIHAGLETTHGITGKIVGTTDTQPLDNKTLNDVKGFNLATGVKITSDDPTLEIENKLKAITSIVAGIETPSKVLVYDDLGQPTGVTPLDINSKVPIAYVPAFIWGNFQDVWDASTTNYPTGDHEKGDYYICTVSGTVNSISYTNTDIIIWDGVEWEKLDLFQDSLSAYEIYTKRIQAYDAIIKTLKLRGKNWWEILGGFNWGTETNWLTDAPPNISFEGESFSSIGISASSVGGIDKVLTANCSSWEDPSYIIREITETTTTFIEIKSYAKNPNNFSIGLRNSANPTTNFVELLEMRGYMSEFAYGFVLGSNVNGTTNYLQGKWDGSGDTDELNELYIGDYETENVFHTFAIRCDGTNAYFYVDGNLFDTVAYSGSFDEVYLKLIDGNMPV
ncbi:MAG: hypothetical protein ACTSWW_13465 [Promethearchaeota archaeon]